jgi:hypothetical protein
LWAVSAWVSSGARSHLDTNYAAIFEDAGTA